ncbi:MAG: Glycosyl transferase, group 1 [Parcubacteria group bacterium GW2011_GWE2_38_18]|nr:MAG: Glycosyl transferase, group 1 [Parcubacteria group bacterium GW2011_GWE2_38_18]
MENKDKIKMAVVHDHLGFCGGGERTVLLIANSLGADFITAYASPNTFPELQKDLGSKLIILSKRVIYTRVVRFFWLRALFWKNKKLFKNYDLVIASSPTATEVVANYSKPNCVRIVYTHTTPRRIFDQYVYSKKTYPLILQPLFALFVKFWRWTYIRASMKFNFNIANSNCVKKRVEDHTGGEVNAVIWPPIITENFKWLGQSDYYISWARIDELKRIELIVEAFKKMPEKKLIVASTGPRYQAIKNLAAGHKNIQVLGWVTDDKLFELVGNCLAAIYIPVDEDAGMTHLEANAAGKPAIVVAEGGLVESTIDGETGILIKSKPSVDDLIKAVKLMTPEWCISKKEICIQHVKEYDKEIFIKKINQVIKDNDPQKPIIGIDASRWEDPRYPGQEKRTGVEIYSKYLIESLVPLIDQSKFRIRIYTPRTIPNLPFEFQKVIPGQKKWTKKFLTQELKHSPIDYFFTPSYFIPKHAPENSYVTIHDVIFKSSPEKYSTWERFKQNYAVKQNIKRAKKIITVSEFSKNEISKYFNIAAENIIVAPIGHNLWTDIEKNKTRNKSILFIGRIEKKKSIDMLINAFYEFQKNKPEWKLILAGKPGYGIDDTKKLIKKLGLEKKIDLLGYVSEETKKDLLTTSSIYAHPSSNEGSCIPLFESWDAGIPAVVSDSEIFREIGGGAVLFFKSGDAISLTEQLTRLADDADLRKKLIEQGKNLIKNMAWEKTAKTVVDTIVN